MDEVRLHCVNEFAIAVLRITDTEAGSHFQENVLRREASSLNEYHRQQDYAAHTLYNYILVY